MFLLDLVMAKLTKTYPGMSKRPRPTNPRYAEAWSLHVSGLTFAGIGKEMGISPERARQMVYRWEPWAAAPPTDFLMSDVGAAFLQWVAGCELSPKAKDTLDSWALQKPQK